MTQVTITINTEETLKQKAEEYFGWMGTCLEDAINQYLSEVIEEDSGFVPIFEVPDEAITMEQRSKIDWTDQLSKKDFFIHSENECN